MKRMLVGAGLGLLAIHAMAAEPCKDNFTAEGNFLTGKTYKTWAMLPGVRQDDAFARAYAFTVANGFTVTSSSKEAGAISAQQSVSYGKGKSVPLGIVLQTEGSDTRIAINYATGGGQMSPEDAIKRHFCMTVAAAASGQGAAPVAGAVADAPAPARAAPAPLARGAKPGYAAASAEQLKRIDTELAKPVTGDKLKALVTDAKPAVQAFIAQLACLQGNSAPAASAMNVHAAPGVNLVNVFGYGPMYSLQYHDRATCMTVSRLHGWTAPANNALSFEAVFAADDSGEVVKFRHEAVRQPDGTWLFTR